MNFGILAIAWKEIRERGFRLASGLLAITLGTAVIVGISEITAGSRRAVSLQLDLLGANILVLPSEASLDDYYTADIDGPTFPEAYVERIVTSMIPGVDNLSPKLSRRMTVNGFPVVLTGIIPASEIAAKPVWQSYALANASWMATCAKNPANETTDRATKTDGKAAASEAGRALRSATPAACPKAADQSARIITDLAPDEAWIGSLAAKKLKITEGETFPIGKISLKASRILPETGTVDDSRIFAHLRTVQSLLGTGRRINVIEIMGCCNAITEGLLGKLRNVLPDTRIVTINHIVSAQVETNRLLARVTIILLILVVAVGAISIGNYMWANVEERRKEIGVFITVGFRPRHIHAMFLFKAVIMGFAGGVFGFVLGAFGAAVLGPMLAGIAVPPNPVFLLWSILLSVGIAVLGTIYPTWRATRIDPAVTMQEL
jgi:putative ABC transport system permease protein